MGDIIRSSPNADGHIAWIQELDTYSVNYTAITSRVGIDWDVRQEWHIWYRSYLSFDTSMYESISATTLWFYVNSYVGTPPLVGWKVGVYGGTGWIGGILDTSDWGGGGTNLVGLWDPLVGIGWKSLNVPTNRINPGGDSDYEFLPMWSALDEDQYIIWRQTEYAGTDYDPYLDVTGILKPSGVKKRLRIFPRVTLLRPVRRPSG